MLVCTHCHAENPVWAPNCQSCQTPLQPSTNCPNCGTLVLKRFNFCGQCGTDLRQGSLERWEASSGADVPQSVPLNLEPPPSSLENLTPDGDITAAQVPFSPHLIHLRTQNRFPLPLDDTVVYLGKPNDRHPPDIDLSQFPDADVVSRVHARIVVKSGDYYIEDMGSSNGTYLNETVLSPHKSRRLAEDDRISLGRNNLVCFSFHV
ncbi:MAG: FHA domain-containing protein [Prochlorotrichaceae cyanobacterium]